MQRLDIVLCAIAIAAMIYLGIEYEGMYLRTGFEPNTADWIFALAAVVLTIEMSRRALAWSFPVMAIAFIAYALWSGALPGFLGHRGYAQYLKMPAINAVHVPDHIIMFGKISYPKR